MEHKSLKYLIYYVFFIEKKSVFKNEAKLLTNVYYLITGSPIVT